MKRLAIALTGLFFIPMQVWGQAPKTLNLATAQKIA